MIGLGCFGEVEDGDDVGVVAESAHGTASRLMRALAGLIELLGLDEGEGHVSIEDGVVGEVDLLLAALAEELLDLIATVGKGGGNGRGWSVVGRWDRFVSGLLCGFTGL